MFRIENVSGSSPRKISSRISVICAATVLVLVTFPAQAIPILFTPIVTYTTTILPTYSTMTCPPRVTRVQATTTTSVFGVLSSTFYRTVGARVQMTSPTGFVTVRPSNTTYNTLPVATVGSSIDANAIDSFPPPAGTYRARGTHLLIDFNGTSIVQSPPQKTFTY